LFEINTNDFITDRLIVWGDESAGGQLNTNVAIANLSISSTSTSSLRIASLSSTERAFAVLLEQGSVICWGHSKYGGDCNINSDVSTSIASDVISLYSNEWSFFAVKADGSVIIWGSKSVVSSPGRQADKWF
jgi:hypothetical protein